MDEWSIIDYSLFFDGCKSTLIMICNYYTKRRSTLFLLFKVGLVMEEGEFQMWVGERSHLTI